MRAVLAVVFLLQFAAPGAAPAQPVSSEVQFLTGDGYLSAGIDSQGRLVHLRWPGPWQWEHVGVQAEEADAAPAGEGAGWLIRDGADWVPIAADGWSVRSGYTTPDSLVIATHFESPRDGRTARQRVLLWPGEDVLVVELQLQGFPPDTRIAWYQNFAPVTRNVTGLGGAAPPAGPERGFAAWYDPERAVLTQFRPMAPGRSLQTRARELAGEPPTPGGWDQFGKGVYLSTLSPNTVVAAHLAEVGAPLPDGDRHAAAGRAWARVELAPEPAGGAVVFTAILGLGETSVDARTAASLAHLAGLPAVSVAAESLGAEWLRGARTAPAPAAIQRDILNLLLCIDRASGAVLRAPAGNPPQAYATVFDAVWASAALDALGYTDAGGRALQLHLDGVRPDGGAGYPPGSLPAAVYTTGDLARFDGAADPASAAWLLAACWRHAISLGPEDGGSYLESAWPVLARCADYLAREPGVGRALAGVTSMPDVPLRLLDAHYLGLECARRSVEMLGGEESGMVAERRSELYARIRFRRLNAGASGEAGDPWINRWLRELAGLGLDAESGWQALLDSPEAGAIEKAVPASIVPAARSDAPVALRDALRCLGGLRRAATPHN